MRWSQGRWWNQSRRFSGQVAGSANCSRSGGTIERDGVAALRGAIEPDAVRVGAVVVDRRPVGAACVLHVDPGAGAVVVALGHDVVQAERRHVVDDRLARAQHHLFHGRDEAFVGRERHAQPLVGDLVGGEAVVPREPAEGVPVRLGEGMAAPVAVVADVRDGGDAAEQGAPAVGPEGAVREARHRPSRPQREGVRIEHLLEQRRQVREVRSLSQVFLGDLQLQHRGRGRDRREQRVKRLARLKVDGAVLDLQADVGAEKPVERRQLAIGLLRPILGDVGLVDEGPPDHDGAGGRRARQRAYSRHPRGCDRSPAARAGLRSSP